MSCDSKEGTDQGNECRQTRGMNAKTVCVYLSISTHHHLLATKHHVGSSLQAGCKVSMRKIYIMHINISYIRILQRSCLNVYLEVTREANLPV